jgi:agmatine deiminase
MPTAQSRTALSIDPANMKSKSGESSSKTLAQPASRRRMPAEWEPHEATWLAWPHHHADWPGKFEPVPWVYAEIIRYLSRYERVEIIVNDVPAEKKARKILGLAHALNQNVRFHRWPTNRVWTRDSGCTFVHYCEASDPATGSSQLAAVKWRFNAWAKYANWRHDEKAGSQMARAAGAPELRAACAGKPVVLEGGSIDVNGAGTLLTTEECLLSEVQQRNPGMKRADYEKIFAEYLGIKHVVWLNQGVCGDDTHGHVDDLTRFVSHDTVVTSVESDPKDSNYEPLRENLRRLRSATDQDGKSLAIVDLPMPKPVIFKKVRLPASYANFYIANGVVLVPVFNDPNDRVALDILADLFPSREVTGIYCGDLLWGLGAIHCMTQQQPRL